MRSISRFLFVSLLTVALLLPGTFAQGKGKGQGKGTGTSTGSGSSTGKGKGSGPEQTSPGYEKGKKTGWGECDVPPGQAKPAHCTDQAKGKAKHKAKATSKGKGKRKG